MKRMFVLILGVCLAGIAATAQEPCFNKMTPLVRKAACAASASARALPPRGGEAITAFVRADPAVAADVFSANGCSVLDSSGDIFIVSVPVGRLAALSAEAAVSRIEASSPCSLTMDTTSTVINATPVYAGRSLPQAFTGRGVVVGVMDIGFDLTHPTFLDTAMSACRVGAFWDMLDPDTIGSGLPVGRDYVGAAEVAVKRHSTDGLLQTHGTHTLGIAAGSGYDSPFRGMAFESDICAVSNAVTDDSVFIDPEDIYKYTSATDALGFKYIFDYAESRGKPCVISFSEGSIAAYGSEDSLYSAYLGRLTGPGRIIVASAGNESVRDNYVPKPAGKPAAGSFLFSFDSTARLMVQSDGPFSLSLLSYGVNVTDTFTIVSSPAAADAPSEFTVPLQGGSHSCKVTVTRRQSAFAPADSLFDIVLSCDVPITSLDPLAVVVEGARSAVSLGCISPAMFANALAGEEWADAEMSHNVLAPGCFPGVITVGATIHRTAVTNYLGQYLENSQPGRNDGVLAYYSSVGPTFDGRTKPDVVAPGTNVVSSYSSYYEEYNPDAPDTRGDVGRFSYNGRTYSWNCNTGTSMSTPVVAGTIALWLQARPDLTPEEALDALAHTCRHPESGLEYPNNRYGHGEIDAYRGLLYLLGIDGILGVSHAQPQHLRAAVTRGGQLVIGFSEAPSSPVTVRVYSLSGRVEVTEELRPDGQSSASIDVSALPSGVYVVQTDSREHGFTGSTLVRR